MTAKDQRQVLSIGQIDEFRPLLSVIQIPVPFSDDWDLQIDGAHEFARAIESATLAAIAQQAQEPVYWEWRHLGSNQHAADFGQWSQWQKVEARSLLSTVEDELQEFRRYIADGYKYELRALYTTPPAPQVPAPVDELIEALEDLMDWQVKNVKSWHNRAYDRAYRAIKKHRAALQSPAPQTKGQP